MNKRTRKFRHTVLFGLMAALSGPALSMNVLNIGDPGITDVLFKGTTGVQNTRVGRSMASGDFNGDGLMDLAIGAPGMNGPRGETQRGAIFIYYGGSASGIGALPDEVPMENTEPGGIEDAMLFGTSNDEAAGDIMVSGDFNGDGKDDLAIVAQYQQITSLGTTAFTKVYVVYGHATRLSGQVALSDLGNTAGQGTIIRGTTGTPTFHVSAMTTGDVIGDSADELVFSDTKNNAFYVFLGKYNISWDLDLELTDSDITLTHSEDTNLFSTDYFPLYNQNLAIAGVAIGDFNGDNINDLALGVPNESIETPDVTNAGQVYVIYGDNIQLVPGALSLDLIADVKIHGGQELDKAGGPLAMGDFNNDNIQDLMIGEPMSQRGTPGTTGLGQVQVVYGSTSPAATVDLFNQADITLHLSGSGAVGDVGRKGFKTGQAIMAEDVNGDNIDDMTISSPYAFFSTGQNGWVHVVHGGGSLKTDYALDIDADQWLLTPEPTEPLAAGNMGEALAAGDFDDDGRPDLAMGAPEGSADGATNAGFVPLLFAASTKIGCSGDPDAIVESSFPANPTPYICQGTKTLVTSGDVTVEDGATVMFYSPEITLSPGFKVAQGGIFSANDLM